MAVQRAPGNPVPVCIWARSGEPPQASPCAQEVAIPATGGDSYKSAVFHHFYPSSFLRPFEPMSSLHSAGPDAIECARITALHARTFSLASRLLPREKRRAANALYAFCRLADDLVDQQSARSTTDLHQDLLRYRGRLDEALRGTADSAVLRELMWVVRTYEVPSRPLYELIEGVGRDLTTQRYERWTDVSRYCEGVASSVGEMCTHVFGVPATGHDGDDRFSVAIGHARTLGRAMQLTNILRDVGEDARRGRCYLPSEELAQYGLSVDGVLNDPAVALHPGWKPLMQFQITRARQLYAESRPGIAMLAADAQRCAVACARGYAGILDAIEAQHYDTVTRRARMKTPARLRLLWQAWRHRPEHPGTACPSGNSAPWREANAL
ncbi:MAG TPA: phytoene/squalene synthase family protein [Gemmatimonas aurantiaca]|nr:phytoene/squalene synthase family protein [Gemmatimonas aurantiaca]